ncbi:MAG: glutathione synthase, partial [Moorea sp. SIO2I5]|nr:glutathione synthase [Moorena sp. SIO2I5]
MKFALIIDPLPKLDPGHDTSVALMEAAQELGHEVWVTQAQQLSVIQGQAWGLLEPVQLTPAKLDDGHWVVSEQWDQTGKAVLKPLEEMDAVWMRTDPPVTIPYLYATYILDYINPDKTLVINSPTGIRTANEKMYALQFQEVMPQTIVSQEKSVIRQ